MRTYLLQGFSLYLRIFFLFTPFFILSTYLSITRGIEGIPKGYVAKDNIEYGYLNTVPLWAFGLNY